MIDASKLITVVIPVYNRASIVEDTLLSISNQEIKPSVILVDNNSTDGSKDVISRWAGGYDKPVSVLTQKQPGAPAARNLGLDAVTTPYVMFFDSDDVMTPNHIARVAETMTKHPEADIVGWDVDIVLLDGNHFVGAFSDKDLWFRHIFNAILSTQRYCIRTHLVREAGAWDTELPGWNDYELGMRLLKSSPRVIKLHGSPTVVVRRQEQSISGCNFSSARGRWEASLDHCAADISQLHNRHLDRWLRLRRAVLAAQYSREGAQFADETLNEAIAGENIFIRLLLRVAFHYTRFGGRGIHLLLRRLL